MQSSALARCIAGETGGFVEFPEDAAAAEPAGRILKGEADTRGQEPESQLSVSSADDGETSPQTRREPGKISPQTRRGTSPDEQLRSPTCTRGFSPGQTESRMSEVDMAQYATRNCVLSTPLPDDEDVLVFADEVVKAATATHGMHGCMEINTVSSGVLGRQHL